MLNKLIENSSKIHARDIQLATYPISDSKVLVHGILKDYRHVRVFDAAGTLKEPGVVHHIDVKLLIRSIPLVIEEAEAEMIKVPMNECRKTLDAIKKINGLMVRSGFSRNVRHMLGGKKGCNHLSQLVVVMGQEVVSGWLTQKRRKKSELPRDIDSFAEKDYILDSCRMWSEEGPRFKNLLQRITAHKEE